MTLDQREKLRSLQVAQYLQISPSTLAKWRMNGAGPKFHKCGPRIVYYYKDEITAWLADCDQVNVKTKTSPRHDSL